MPAFTPQPNRDASDTIRGYVYQVDLTIERWLSLSPGELLELECGEDIDLISRSLSGEEERRLEQVKNYNSSVTLWSAVTAIANFVEHRENNSQQKLKFLYTTTASVTIEKHSPEMLKKKQGIVVWEQIRQGTLTGISQNEALGGIRIILSKDSKPKKFSEKTWAVFRNFITTASNEKLLHLICSLEWSTNTPDPKSLRACIRQTLIQQDYSTNEIQAKEQYQRLFLYVFKLLSQPNIKQLTVEERTHQLSLPTLSKKDHNLLQNLIFSVLNLESRVGTLEQDFTQLRDAFASQVNDLQPLRRQYVGISGTKGSSTFIDTLPQIQAVRIFGSYDKPRIQLRGFNFKQNAKVLVGEVEIPVVRSTQTLLEALLPPVFSGMVKVVVDSHESQEIYCAAPSDKQQHTNLYEVVKAEIPLYADQHCTCQQPGVVGLLKHPIGGRADVLDIIPTYPGIYKAGYYITNGVFDERTSVGETWYRDPDKGEINYAWTASFIMAPHIVCQVGQEKLGGISILPNPINIEVDDCRALLVKDWIKDGLIETEVDITNKVLWKSLDDSIAIVKNGVVYPQRLGKTLIECEFKGFFDSVELSVGQYNKGDKVVYFQGFRELQQIRFDADDNLYFCQQPNSVYKLSPQGKLEEIIRLSTPDTIGIRMNCIAIDSYKNLYVNDLFKGVCLRFAWNEKQYTNPEPFATCIEGSKKGITLDSEGNIFVGVPTGYQQGYIIHIHPDGSETAFRTEDTPYWLALDSQGNICTPSDKNSAVHVYNREGNLIKIIPYGIQDRATDILLDPEGSIYLPLYYGKNILKITPMDLNARCEIIAKGINSPSGIAKDSQGRIYVLSLQAQDSFIIKIF